MSSTPDKSNRNDEYGDLWTSELILACQRAGWYLPKRSQGLPGSFYPSDNMRAFKAGYEEARAAQPSAEVPYTAQKAEKNDLMPNTALNAVMPTRERMREKILADPDVPTEAASLASSSTVTPLAHALMIVNMLLEDVVADPSRLIRAQYIAARDLTPLFAPSATQREAACLHACEGIETIDLQGNEKGWLADVLAKLVPVELNANRYEYLREHGMVGPDLKRKYREDLDAEIDKAMGAAESRVDKT